MIPRGVTGKRRVLGSASYLYGNTDCPLWRSSCHRQSSYRTLDTHESRISPTCVPTPPMPELDVSSDRQACGEASLKSLMTSTCVHIHMQTADLCSASPPSPRTNSTETIPKNASTYKQSAATVGNVSVSASCTASVPRLSPPPPPYVPTRRPQARGTICHKPSCSSLSHHRVLTR